MGSSYTTDYRLPENRRETFHKFYEFHLKYRSHPGCVYYLIPYLGNKYGWNKEDTLWFTFLNGNTQNPVTSLILHRRFPDPDALGDLPDFFNNNWDRLKFDTDRRWQKKDFLKSVSWFQERIREGTQEDYWTEYAQRGFKSVWEAARAVPTFGRLSAFSFLEYQRIAGIPVECDTLFLRDLKGSKSHRNGLCKLNGRDDLDWHDKYNPDFNGDYTEHYDWLEEAGETLLSEAKTRAKGKDWEKDVSYFTLESALCTYKSWFRPNRRYPNVYNDMLYLRIKEMEKVWDKEDLTVFWEARKDCLPDYLLLECNPRDPGLSPEKQNHFRETGQVVMMDRDYPEFANDFNDRVNKGETPIRTN